VEKKNQQKGEHYFPATSLLKFKTFYLSFPFCGILKVLVSKAWRDMEVMVRQSVQPDLMVTGLGDQMVYHLIIENWRVSIIVYFKTF